MVSQRKGPGCYQVTDSQGEIWIVTKTDLGWIAQSQRDHYSVSDPYETKRDLYRAMSFDQDGET